MLQHSPSPSSRAEIMAAPASALPSATVSPSRRPHHGLLVGLHLAAAVAFFYKLRVEPRLEGVPVDFNKVVDTARFPNGMPLKTAYFGLPAIDSVLTRLVVAFVAGPASWDISSRLQQIYFFYNFAVILAVHVVESRRTANARRLTTWIALWAILYQTLGGALVVPLWFALDLMTSNDADRLFAVRRHVPLPYAQFVLPATIAGYLLPTALLFVPWGWSHEVNQILTALWQPGPLLVSLFLMLFANAAMTLSVTTSASGPTSHAGFPNARAGGPPRENVPGGDISPPDDVFYLKTYYFMVGMLCFVVHAYVLYQIQTNGYAELVDGPGTITFASVFLPSRDLWKSSLAAGLHYGFQWDAIGIFATTLTWSCVKTWDIQRATAATFPKGVVSGTALVRSAALITLANTIVGPGATLMAIWYWRENRLVELAAALPGTKEAKKFR
ncbi:hypothetical protein MN608_08136 [Microdochium nivale]|nr:hypothetical protein MN608_08136 [Microdochium nivale]